MNRFISFLSGRYGRDDFGTFLTWSSLVLMIIGLIFRAYPIYILALLLAFYNIFRAFSRKTDKRRKENQVYLRVKDRIKRFFRFEKIKAWFKLQKNRFRDRKTHVYQKCPYCKKVLRLKKVKGTHTVSCPCCNRKFDIKI